MTCPVCRAEHAEPKEGFISHFLLARLVEHLVIHEGEREREDKQKRMCLKHEGEELKVYCWTCQCIICRDCAILTHRGHDYLFIKDAIEAIVQNLQQLMFQVEEKDATYQAYIRAVTVAMTAKKQQFSICEKLVDEYFAEYIAKIQRHKASLLDKLHHAKVNDKVALAMAKEDLESTSARLLSAIAFTKQLLSSGNMADIAHLSQQTSEQLRSLTKLKKPQNVDDRTWLFVQKELPTECSILPSFRPSFVNPPKEVPHGLNKFDIRSPVSPNVSISCTDSGKPCKVTGITSTGPSSWHVSYIIPAPPLTSGVQIRAQALEENVSMRVACIQTLAVGTRVVYIGRDPLGYSGHTGLGGVGPTGLGGVGPTGFGVGPTGLGSRKVYRCCTGRCWF